MTTFTLDVAGLRARLQDEDPDELPWLGESPGRQIDEIISDYGDEFISAEGWSGISVYAMVWDSDPDTVMVVARRNDYRRAGLAGISQDWDDLLPGRREEYYRASPLSVDQVVTIVQAVVDEANRIIDDDTTGATA